MTIDDIKNLVSADESRTLELKKTTGELKDGMHSACAFSGLSIKRKAQRGMQALKTKLVQPIVRKHQNFIKTSLPSAD